jgi:threonyl-tRNA synthetase
LRQAGIRAEVHDRDTLSYRIREAELLKIPYMAVIGEREVADQTVAVRRRGAGRKQEVLERSAFMAQVQGEIRGRTLDAGAEPAH